VTKAFLGCTAYPGYAIGPAFVLHTWSDIIATHHLKMPVVLVAPYLEKRALDRIDKRRIYGIVVDRGSVVDPLWEELWRVPKPSLIGCRGAYEATKNDDLVAIDGKNYTAVVRPEGTLLAHYQNLKGTRCPRDPKEVQDVLLRFGDTIRQARYFRGYRNPLDLPGEAGQLFEIARRVARGEGPTPEQNEYVRGLLDPPPAPPIPDPYKIVGREEED
jgi:hypothetical protein